MKVSFHANVCDSSTAPIAGAIRPTLDSIGLEVSGDYGGSMEHLWIDFELIERDARLQPQFRFRFQKRVGGSVDRLTGLQNPVFENVGHYSVRPDFRRLKAMPLEAVVGYVLNAIYSSTAILMEKQKRLGGFDAAGFRSAFVAACQRRGHFIGAG